VSKKGFLSLERLIMQCNDSFISSELFNALTHVNDQSNVKTSDLLELGAVFQKYKVVDKYVLGLLHRHYDITPGKIAVTTDIASTVSITRPGEISSLDGRSIRGQLYFLYNDNWQAYEYEDEEFDPNFLRELAEKIRSMGLQDKISLGSSKKSLGTREMHVAPDATASISSSCLGRSWGSLEVDVREVGWGFLPSTEYPGIVALESFVGHAINTTNSHHVVLYGVNNCSYTVENPGLLEGSDLKKGADYILGELKKRGWVHESFAS
jgi:hypothetical protein